MDKTMKVILFVRFDIFILCLFKGHLKTVFVFLFFFKSMTFVNVKRNPIFAQTKSVIQVVTEVYSWLS